jgi:hypothetical protein
VIPGVLGYLGDHILIYGMGGMERNTGMYGITPPLYLKTCGKTGIGGNFSRIPKTGGMSGLTGISEKSYK